MFNEHQDQAESLRRMMASSQQRAVSILSTSVDQSQTRLLTNIAATLNADGANVVVVHTSNETTEKQYAISQMPALYDVAMGNTLLLNAIKMSAQGFAVAKLTHHDHSNVVLNPYENQQLEFVLEELTHEFDYVLVDAALNEHNRFPLTMLNESEVLIQLSTQPSSIKTAYSLIKRICSQVGRRTFNIAVDNATDSQAMQVFNNIASVAWQYLKIKLSYFGAIPADNHLARAAMEGRSVIDAFPMANASIAYRKMVQHFNIMPNAPQHHAGVSHQSTDSTQVYTSII